LADTLAVSLDYLTGRTNSDKGSVQSLDAGEDPTPQPPAKRSRPRKTAPVG